MNPRSRLHCEIFRGGIGSTSGMVEFGNHPTMHPLRVLILTFFWVLMFCFRILEDEANAIQCGIAIASTTTPRSGSSTRRPVAAVSSEVEVIPLVLPLVWQKVIPERLYQARDVTPPPNFTVKEGGIGVPWQ